MEVTTAERYASGGELGELPAQNLVKAFYGIGREARRRRRDPDRGRRVLDQLERAARPRPPHRRRPRQARREEGRHRRPHAQQPPGVHPRRPGRGLAGRRPVLDLPDLLARADPVRLLGRRAARSRSSRRCSSTCSTRLARTCRRSRHVIVVDGDGGDHTLEEVEQMDPGLRSRRGRWTSSQPDDMLTLIYTSGTTGPPKGVQLTHRNLMGADRRRRRDRSTSPSAAPR